MKAGAWGIPSGREPLRKAGVEVLMSYCTT